MTRLASHVVVSGLIGAAQAVGGNGAVLARGDPDGGAMLVVLTSRGVGAGVFERLSSLSGGYFWHRVESCESSGSQSVAHFIAAKQRFDPDLWVIELDIPDVEQFIVDSLSQT